MKGSNDDLLQILVLNDDIYLIANNPRALIRKKKLN